MGALPCTPRFILLLARQTLRIRRSFYNSFLLSSAFLSPSDFVLLGKLSPLHPLALQDQLGPRWTADVSSSSDSFPTHET